MRRYRLENRAQDREFLEERKTVCRAVFENDLAAPGQGEPILVELSNGKKYKGIIVEFRSFSLEKYLAGDLVIARP